MKISSFPAAPLRQLVRMCLFYLSYLDNGPPTLNFKQNIVMQNGFHFLFGHRVHQQLLEQREHPHRMQVNDKIGHSRIYIRVLLLHGGEPCLDQPGRTVGVASRKCSSEEPWARNNRISSRLRCVSMSETYSSIQAFRYFRNASSFTSSPRMP